MAWKARTVEELPGGRGPGWVDDKWGAVTIAERFPRLKLVILMLALAILLGSAIAQNSQTWQARQILVTMACLVIAAAAVFLSFRAWRIGLRLGGDGVTVRNIFRTYQISWPEMLCFADGSISRGQSCTVWALDVVLRDGRVIIASAASRSRGVPAPRRWPRSGRPLDATRYRQS